MPGSIEKVTAFVIRRSPDGYDLLLFKHPTAGIQIPAGTVEPGEAPETAALREAAEETGLSGLRIRRYLGCLDEALPERYRLIGAPTKVFSRPDPSSFDWAQFRRGITVRLDRPSGDFTQVTYEEFDRIPDPDYVTYRITGWVPNHTLAETGKRHFFLLAYEGPSRDRWETDTDHHRFTLFWAPVAALPPLIPPQDAWLNRLKL
jgi:8-oxo-dGTP pyrophosphatase MutT (NUDIX family)